MALGSRLKAIDQAMATIITAAVDASVTVTRGHPGTALTFEAVWTDTITFEEDPHNLGATRQSRRQKIHVPIVVRIKQEGNDYPTLRDRACDVADQVEEALRNPTNGSLNGAADFGWVESGALESFKDTDGRIGSVTLLATYTATKGP